MLDAIGNVFAISQLTFANPTGEAVYRFFVAMRIVENQQTTHARSLYKQMPLDARALW